MDKEIGRALAQEALQLLRGTKAFVLAQAPDFMRQVLAWKTAEAAVGLAVAALVALALPTVFGAAKKGWSNGYDTDGENATAAVAGSVAFIFLSLLVPLVGYDSLMQLIKIYFAPKIFLLEYFARLVR